VRGVSGLLFRELAYVIAFSLVCSLIVSLSLVPMLASKLLRRGARRGRSAVGRLTIAADHAFIGLENAYRDLLAVVLRHRVLTLAATGVLLAGSLTLAPRLGTEFLPPSDEGEVRVDGEMEVGTRLDLVDRQTRQIEAVVTAHVPELVAWVTSVGSGGWNPGDAATGEVRMSLVPSAERDRSNVEIAEDLRRRLEGTIAGMRIRTRAPQGQFLLDRILGGDDGLTVEVRGYDLGVLAALTGRALEALRGVDGLENHRSSVDEGMPQEEIRIDRAKAADVGVSVRDIAEALETAVAGSRAGEFRPQGASYRIIVQLRDAIGLSMDEILDLTVRSASGDDVALRNLVTSERGRGPMVIQRKDQQRLNRVTADFAGRDLGSVTADVEAALEGIPRPAGYEFILSGKVEEQRESSRELALSLALALALVYMVLACQYESLRDPLIVMISAPLAVMGVIVALFITDTTLNVQSYIGCIMLGGIVVNNAILLVDQAGQLRRRHDLPVAEAVAEAGRRRLRAILMTSLTTILGLTPLALGVGEGADAQAPLARAVIGGLLSSMLTTLIVVPAVYSLAHPEPERAEPR
jgi:HAE1 family hydrophobic/amphiphilic exporter-1